MNARLLGIACVLGLSACGNSGTSSNRTASVVSAPVPIASATAPTPPTNFTAADSTQLARYDGYGDLRFGMDEKAFDKAWGGELKGLPEKDSTCFYKSPKWAKSLGDFSFMFEEGRFARYDVSTAKQSAPGGGRIGMSIAQIQMLYGSRVKVQPHFYEQGASYLRIPAPQGKGVLLLETDEHGKVTRWRVGVPPQVDYVEGCL